MTDSETYQQVVNTHDDMLKTVLSQDDFGGGRLHLPDIFDMMTIILCYFSSFLSDLMFCKWDEGTDKTQTYLLSCGDVGAIVTENKVVLLSPQRWSCKVMLTISDPFSDHLPSSTLES
jgi:hypothetical protein